MRTGFAILAHERLDRVAALAAPLAAAGAPVAIHVDTRVPPAALGPLAGLPASVRVLSTRRAEWGMFGLVDAALDAARALEKLEPDLRHVCLLSGACLPIRPLYELEAFLAARPDTDFIESVPVDERPWVQDGLSAERFTLWFPVPWRRRRRLFDAMVRAQRALGVRRRMPEGVEPRLGLQWWCLSTTTLRSLLSDPRLPAWRRFFRRCWIPDECFFQSIVPLLAEGTVEPRPLTLQRFDAWGRPVVFHDDHLALLEGADHFFARKIDPDAGALYRRFLGPEASAGAGREGLPVQCCDSPPARDAVGVRVAAAHPAAPQRDPGPDHDDGGAVAFAPARPAAGAGSSFHGLVDEAPFAAARQRARSEGRGVLSAARLPAGTGAASVDTVRPYVVLIGDEPDRLDQMREALIDCVPVFHGRLFGPRPAVFARPGDAWAWNLSGAPRLRDYRPAQFLARLIWAERDRATAFLFAPSDSGLIAAQVLQDPNARLVFCGPAPSLDAALSAAAALPVPRRAWSRKAADADAAAAALSSDWHDPSCWTVQGPP